MLLMDVLLSFSSVVLVSGVSTTPPGGVGRTTLCNAVLLLMSVVVVDSEEGLVLLPSEKASAVEVSTVAISSNSTDILMVMVIVAVLSVYACMLIFWLSLEKCEKASCEITAGAVCLWRSILLLSLLATEALSLGPSETRFPHAAPVFGGD